MQHRNIFKAIFIMVSLFMVVSCQQINSEKQSILVFSKTSGFRHDSIAAGIEAINALAAKDGISVKPIQIVLHH